MSEELRPREEHTDEAPPLFSKEHRRAERARIARLNRLPGPFQAYADRGRREVVLVNLLQAAVVVVLTLAVCRAATGSYLPRYVAIVALGVSVTLTALNRRANSRVATLP